MISVIVLVLVVVMTVDGWLVTFTVLVAVTVSDEVDWIILVGVTVKVVDSVVVVLGMKVAVEVTDDVCVTVIFCGTLVKNWVDV